MMHLCRNLFSTLLEEPGVLYNLLCDHFAPYKYLCEDIINQNMEDQFKDYVYGLKNSDNKKNSVGRDPFDLMSEAGYNLYECKTEADIQKFKKYYKENEILCTIKNGNRLKSCYVFFAVKKSVEEIKREDFQNPKREDEYGTSVISIQFTRGNVNTLSIKNRYNHTVLGPDATYSNNLENIIEGLTASFEEKYNLNINSNYNSNFELRGYVYTNDAKYYKYNLESNSIFYCPNNILVDEYNVITNYTEKEKYIIMDGYILDIVNKKFIVHDEEMGKDSFLDAFKEIKRISIEKKKNSKNKIITIVPSNGDDILIELDKDCNIESYYNPNISSISYEFLYNNRKLKRLILPNVKNIGDLALAYNQKMEELYLPKVETIGAGFLFSNVNTKKLYLPKLKRAGLNFLFSNVYLEKMISPNLENVGHHFLYHNQLLKTLYLPKLKDLDRSFLYYNSYQSNFIIGNDNKEKIKKKVI